jgi:hypothetical protein
LIPPLCPNFEFLDKYYYKLGFEGFLENEGALESPSALR